MEAVFVIVTKLEKIESTINFKIGKESVISFYTGVPCHDSYTTVWVIAPNILGSRKTRFKRIQVA